jgi:hypothetical protein
MEGLGNSVHHDQSNLLFINEESYMQEEIDLVQEHNLETEVQEAQEVQTLTNEEIRIIELRKRQEQHRKDLEMLTSENCPKNHPYDLGHHELAEIKKEFPLGPLSQGLPISKLKQHFMRIMKLDS